MNQGHDGGYNCSSGEGTRALWHTQYPGVAPRPQRQGSIPSPLQCHQSEDHAPSKSARKAHRGAHSSGAFWELPPPAVFFSGLPKDKQQPKKPKSISRSGPEPKKKPTEKGMPLAGADRSQRALAHYRWAGRYTDTGEPLRGLSHIKRALDYTRGPGTQFGLDLSASQIEELVDTVMRKHNYTDFRQGYYDLPTVAVIGGRKLVELEYHGKVYNTGWTYFPGLPELSLQSIADALEKLAADMSLPTKQRVSLQMYMGEVYILVIEKMREAAEIDRKMREAAESDRKKREAASGDEPNADGTKRKR